MALIDDSRTERHTCSAPGVMPVGFTKENHDLVVEGHNGRVEEVFCLSLFLRLQVLHYSVSRNQIGDGLKTFKNTRILLHVRDRDLRPIISEMLASSYLFS